MKAIRILAVLLLTGIMPTFAGAATYYTPSYSGGISRAEFVRLVMVENGGGNGGGNCFSDVRTQSYAPYVCAAKQRGIVTGKPNGSFSPDQSISFIEAAAIVVRAERGGVFNGNPWYAPYLAQVAEWNAMPSSVTNILDMITYSQAQELINAVVDHEDNDDDDNDDDDDDSDSSNDEMELTITVSDSTPEAGDRVTFRIKLENNDNDDLEDIEVTAELDDDMDYISSTDDGYVDDDEVRWDEIEIDEDKTKTILLTIEVDEDADEDDTLRLKVTAENGSDITASKTIRVDESDNDDDDDDGDLDVTITDSTNSVQEGELFTYAIRLENEDNDDIRVDVRAELDDDVDFVSASDGGDEERNEVEWDDIRLDEDQIKTILLTVRVNHSINDGQKLVLKVEANEENEEETTTVEDDDDDDDNDDDDDADISIDITDSDDTVEIGDTVIYRIELENNDNNDVTVDVTAELPEGMTFLDASHDGEEDDDEVTWEDIEIDEDGRRILTLEVRINNDVDDGDTVRLKVEAGDGSATETTRIED